MGHAASRMTMSSSAMAGGQTGSARVREDGCARGTVHEWLRRYATAGLAGLAGLANGSSKPQSPHQMAQEIGIRTAQLSPLLVSRGAAYEAGEPRPA